jgi:peptide/nickel transport system substrate-binding protein
MFSQKHTKWMALVALLMLGSLILTACGEEEPEVVEKEVTRVVKETVVETVVEKETVVETVVEKETVLETIVEKETVLETVVEEVVITATPSGPPVGGTLTYAAYSDPDTLDAHQTTFVMATQVLDLLGASLVELDPDGKIVPYLAESWTISDDGLQWDFVLRKNVKFHNGDPLTAQDYVWTFERAQDPAFGTGSAPTMISSVETVEVLDDYTLRLNLGEPFFSLMINLASAEYLQPLSRAAVESAGDQYGRNPVSVGPFKFVEWKTGDRVILERNPDFYWGPPFAHEGPPYIERIEFRIIPETSTLVAAFEAGELDFANQYANLQAKDVLRIEATGQYQIFEGLQQGMRPFVLMNVAKPPFDDVRVRKAFNLAVDRPAMIEIRTQGNAVVQYGPLSPSQIGYWEGIEELGYGYDLEQAMALMEEAGYVMGDDGFFEKDGQRLKLSLTSLSQDIWVKAAEILQQQWKELGVEIEIVQEDAALAIAAAQAGDYELMMMGITAEEADILHYMFHSSNLGSGYNMSQVDDPELDELLELTRTLTDPDERQQVVNEAQKLIVEKAYVVPLYAPKIFHVLHNRVKGAMFSPKVNTTWFFDAYIETE